MTETKLWKDLDAIIAEVKSTIHLLPKELSPKIRDLPKVATELRKFVKKRKGKRFPQWKCVEAVDQRWPEKDLVLSLLAMFDKSIIQEPAKQLFDAVASNAVEMSLAECLIEHISAQPDRLPANLSQFRGILLKQTCSDAVGISPSAGFPQNFADEALYFFLALRQLAWEKHHRDRCYQMVLLAEDLNYDALNQILSVRLRQASHLLLSEAAMIKAYEKKRDYGYLKKFRVKEKEKWEEGWISRRNAMHSNKKAS